MDKKNLKFKSNKKIIHNFLTRNQNFSQSLIHFMKYNKSREKNLFLKLSIVSMVLLGNNDARISIWFIYQPILLFKRRIKMQTSSTGGASFSRYSPSKSPLNYYGIILYENHSHLNKVGFPVILTAPDLTWPDLRLG
jgi:hypothetical protein